MNFKIKANRITGSIIFLMILLQGVSVCMGNQKFVTYEVDLKKQDLKFYWKDDKNQIFRDFRNLKEWLEKKNLYLEFAVNGGMYNKQNGPQGLYIENNMTLSKLDTRNAEGNFYLKPNGVFYITKAGLGGVCVSEKFKYENIKYATQSGPMLLIEGAIHSSFKEGSKNLNIRNGVGILPNGNIVFVMSKEEINFFDFALYFKSLGCKNALYLDGAISRTYLPAQNLTHTDGNFGVIIGVTSMKIPK